MANEVFWTKSDGTILVNADGAIRQCCCCCTSVTVTHGAWLGAGAHTFAEPDHTLPKGGPCPFYLSGDCGWASSVYVGSSYYGTPYYATFRLCVSRAMSAVTFQLSVVCTADYATSQISSQHDYVYPAGWNYWRVIPIEDLEAFLRGTKTLTFTGQYRYLSYGCGSSDWNGEVSFAANCP